MDIIINENGKFVTLRIRDKNRVDWTADLLGNAGALNDGSFIWDAAEECYRADWATYLFWDEYIETYKFDEDCIAALFKDLHDKYPYDRACAIEQDFYASIGDALNAGEHEDHHAIKQEAIDWYYRIYLDN